MLFFIVFVLIWIGGAKLTGFLWSYRGQKMTITRGDSTKVYGLQGAELELFGETHYPETTPISQRYSWNAHHDFYSYKRAATLCILFWPIIIFGVSVSALSTFIVTPKEH